MIGSAGAAGRIQTRFSIQLEGCCRRFAHMNMLAEIQLLRRKPLHQHGTGRVSGYAAMPEQSRSIGWPSVSNLNALCWLYQYYSG